MEVHTVNGGHLLNLTREQDLMSLGADGGGGDSNALILQSRKKNKKKGMKQRETRKTPKLSKSQKRKLEKLEVGFEEKEKELLLTKSLETLKKYKIPEYAYSLLKSSGKISPIEVLWSQMLSEAVLEAHERFPNKVEENFQEMEGNK